MKTQIVQIILPWKSKEDGRPYFSAVTITSPGKVDKRVAFRVIRKWYKQSIGVNVPKEIVRWLWSSRHTTWALSEEVMSKYIDDLARKSYEEVITEPDSDTQEEAPARAGE